MDDPVGTALVVDHPGEMVGDAEAALCFSEEHHPAVGGDPSAVKGGAHLLARNRWQVEGQRNILVHQRLPPLDRCAALGRGIMLHIPVSGYFRLVARADEVIE